jgi:hypothetical protein
MLHPIQILDDYKGGWVIKDIINPKKKSLDITMENMMALNQQLELLISIEKHKEE